MLTIGALSFSAPWLLLGLVALPVLWWLLRISPPSPQRIRFPALRLLLGLNRQDQTPAHMPWWLLALRAAIACLILLALAGPLWNAVDRSSRTGPLILVVDTGWAAAHSWSLRQDTLRTLTEEAVRDRRTVMVLPTAGPNAPDFSLLPAEDARRTVAALAPQPYQPDRTRLLDALDDLQTQLAQHPDAEIVWLSDGLDYGVMRELAEKLSALAPLSITMEPPHRRALALASPETDGTTVVIPVLRSFRTSTARRSGTIRMLDANNRTLGAAPFTLEAGDSRSEARFDLPVEVRNRATRIEIDGMTSAAATLLLDATWRRRPVGLASGTGTADDRPLLANLFYLRRALQPYADLRDGPVDALISSGLSVLILSDVGQIVGDAYAATADWVDKGGVLIRFAGPRLAEQSDDLIPVELRRGGRALGGTLSWDTPQGLAPFPETSPFHGLAVPEDVSVRRQVLAEPAADLDEHTWARLADGTPLVTARQRGQGWLVLIHVTANQEWSTLPISGLYVEMLRRMVALSPGISDPAQATGFTGPMAPLRTLTGTGELQPPPANVLPLDASAFDATPGPRNPPGLYGRPGNERAFNLLQGRTLLKAAPDLSDVATQTDYLNSSVTDLRSTLIILAILLALADLAATLRLTGGWSSILRLAGRTTVALVCVGLITGIWTDPATAQTRGTDPALEKAGVTHLAYIKTGDTASDAITRDGLKALNRVLNGRTAFEPGDPVGVDPATDDLVFYPLIYWRVTPGQQPPGSQALTRIDQFMKNGGTILFDTADYPDQNPSLDAVGTSTAQSALRGILNRLDVPPLTPVPEDHVLGKAFYLLTEFPGRYTGGTVWVEASARTGGTAAPSRHDGVSPIVIGSHDWAAAWAKDDSGRPLVATTPGGERQRELAYRFGVNLVMYTLSGNYKADQVHVPAILERLGK